MDWRKISLLASIGIVSWMLMIQWSNFEPPISVKKVEPVNALNTPPIDSERPVFPDNQDEGDIPSTLSVDIETKEKYEFQQDLVVVETDVFDVIIDLNGGDIIDVKLHRYLTKPPGDGGVPLHMMQRSAERFFIASSGLIGRDGTDSRTLGRPVFSTDKYKYLLGTKDALEVDLFYSQNSTDIVKRFVFKRSKYDIDIDYIFSNNSSYPWEGRFFGQLKRDSKPPSGIESGSFLQPPSFLGGARREEDKNFAKYSFSDMAEAPPSSSIKGGWLAFMQHYFTAAWVPPQDEINRFELKQSKEREGHNILSVVGQRITVPAGGTNAYSAKLYVGPKDQNSLSVLAEHLDLVVDYGVFWVICKPIHQAMVTIYGYTGNWGWAIVVLTIIIKILLFPLSARSLKSMARMRSLQPQMERLKELYGEDRQKMGQEQMALWKKEKVNPLGGCLPMLLQMPVFISLFWVLSESVEIRHAPWLLWITDLSSMDPFFILPVIMGISMVAMQKLQPLPTDPTQAKVMQYMPIAFTFMCLWFPSGLVLYWTVNNILSIGQQWIVNRQITHAKSSSTST